MAARDRASPGPVGRRGSKASALSSAHRRTVYSRLHSRSPLAMAEGVRKMSQFPPWPRQITALTDVVAEFAARTRSRCEQLPLAIVGELRRRVNVLDLATRGDVAVQSKLGRNRVSFGLMEVLGTQRDHDEDLL